MMLWMEEKWRMLADEPSEEPGNILQKLRWHKTAERELVATQGHVEGLQQVRDTGQRVQGLLSFSFLLHSTFAWSTVTEGRINLSLHGIRIPQFPPSLSRHPLVLAPELAQDASVTPSPRV